MFAIEGSSVVLELDSQLKIEIHVLKHIIVHQEQDKSLSWEVLLITQRMQEIQFSLDVLMAQEMMGPIRKTELSNVSLILNSNSSKGMLRLGPQIRKP